MQLALKMGRMSRLKSIWLRGAAGRSKMLAPTPPTTAIDRTIAVIHTALPLNPVFMAIPRHADPTAWLFYPWNRPERSARRVTPPGGFYVQPGVPERENQSHIFIPSPTVITRPKGLADQLSKP